MGAVCASMQALLSGVLILGSAQFRPLRWRHAFLRSVRSLRRSQPAWTEVRFRARLPRAA